MSTEQKKVQRTAQVAKSNVSSNSSAKATQKGSEVDALKKQLKQAEEAAALAGKEATAAKKQAEKMEEELKQAKPINVMEAIVKVYDAKEIVARLEFLRDTKKSLSTFSLGRSELKDELKISDGSGNVFQTTNTNTIEVVLETLKNELDSKISNTEQELMQLV